MEDTSYVSLSLEKYNELYDKAKMYDEIKFEEVRKGMFDLLKDYGNISKDNEETAVTEEIDDEIKVGDLVEIIKPKYGARVGVIGKVTYIDEDGDINVKENDDDTDVWYTTINSVKKVNESEEN